MIQMRFFHRLRHFAAAFATLSITACGTATVSKVDADGKTQSPVFPAAMGASRAEGSYVNVDNLAKIASGMTKAQIREQIGTPHFAEGMIGVREWDYIFKFRQPNGESDAVCQYKVLFDKDMIARSFYFFPTNCLHNSDPVAHGSAQIADKTHQMEISTDAIFSFGSAELLPRSQIVLAELARKLRSPAIVRLDIVGHTDRIGDASRNMELSYKRASAVRAYLIQQGIPAEVIRLGGRGASEPLVVCPGVKSAAVVDCLARNRRVTVMIIFK